MGERLILVKESIFIDQMSKLMDLISKSMKSIETLETGIDSYEFKQINVKLQEVFEVLELLNQKNFDDAEFSVTVLNYIER